ncbi:MULTISPECIES: TerC family protein [Paenibacillus]|uniref:Integral membrane protein, YkoY family n=1 Tax=Paenibacillus typhae TaxID=1174501 RepID=A0A1G8KF35_9BACL|nr:MULTISPECIES: TerC family protein [Paenibacillus]MBY0013826.1 TerC family protein [Paenibacillus typhae]MDF9840891.1 YkoY family integral membrane protein [Paenibacillus sp. PastF-2]MDF9847475.1 YkoY family integral membrane protein [Paenibacillus sp. PastM-2]MDF9853948.1 YkoY family integral membrane protein [Paenibacillus sp. PastF-1]MDH6479220.1 YkoY family integral membrane protein [Paenibacillus sp. PastH-2]
MGWLSEFFRSISDNYGHFFSWGDIAATLSDPVSWGIIGSLVLLEGLLSADNALVLAVMVRHLPKEQQKKALFYGILGAYIFRFLAIGLGTYLIEFTLVKVLGALYLFYIAYKGLFKGSGEEGHTENKGASFWKTVLLVELMDIAFSIDSVIAAFGLSSEVWVLFLGGILGVLMMRGVAQVFLKLIARFPELEQAAFLLIAIIAGKMLAGAFGYELPHAIFFTVLIAVFAGTMLYSAAKKKKEMDKQA